MSKIADALKKAEELRKNNHPAPAQQGSVVLSHSMIDSAGIVLDRRESDVLGVSTSDQTQAPAFTFQSSMLIAVALICLFSLLLSARTFAEIRRANNSNSIAVNSIALHEAKIGNLEKSLSDMRQNNESQMADLKIKLNAASVSIKKYEGKINELTVANSDLRSTINDVKWSNKKLAEKLAVVTNKVNSLIETKE